MPTYPSPLSGRKVKLFIDVSNNATPSYSHFCPAETFTLTITNSTETKFLSACDDDNALPQRFAKVTGQEWAISGPCVADPGNTAYLRMKARAISAEEVKVKVEEAATGGTVWTGAVVVKTFAITGRGAFAAVNMELEGAGALTAADYVAP